MVERGAARRRTQRHKHGVPLVHRHGRIIRRRANRACFHRSKRRGARKEHRTTPQGRYRHLPGTVILDTQHKHIPRPEMGTRTRDLRRGPVHELAHGTGRSARTARPCKREIHQAAGLRQAFRSTQRSGKDAPQLQHRKPAAARPLGDLPASIPRPRAARRSERGDVRLPAHRRRPVLRQQPPATTNIARRMGLQRACGKRLRSYKRLLGTWRSRSV